MSNSPVDRVKVHQEIDRTVKKMINTGQFTLASFFVWVVTAGISNFFTFFGLLTLISSIAMIAVIVGVPITLYHGKKLYDLSHRPERMKQLTSGPYKGSNDKNYYKNYQNPF